MNLHARYDALREAAKDVLDMLDGRQNAHAPGYAVSRLRAVLAAQPTSET